ncbi:MAG: serine protease [Clostridia bacterium]
MKKRIIALSFVVILCVSLVGCGFLLPAPKAPEINIEPGVGYDLGEIVATKNIASMVAITATVGSRQSSGAGFVITEDGYVATNAHVVIDNAIPAKNIICNFYNGAQCAAKVEAYDNALDLAILKLVSVNPKFSPVTLSTKPLNFGESAIVIGNPMGVGLSVGFALVASPKTPLEDADFDFIQIDSNINHGNSGGALFDKNSNVVGIVSRRLEKETDKDAEVIGIGFAIPTQILLDFLKKERPSIYNVIKDKVVTK